MPRPMSVGQGLTCACREREWDQELEQEADHGVLRTLVVDKDGPGGIVRPLLKRACAE